MFQFVSFFRGSKATETKNENTGNNSVSIPRTLEINIDVADGEDEFMEVTTRRKTYLEVAKEAIYGQSSKSVMTKDGTTPVFSILTSSKDIKVEEAQKSHQTEDDLSHSGNFDDLDGVNYNLKKSNRYVLKSKNKRTPSYYKELKVRKNPIGTKKSGKIVEQC